MNRCTHSHLHQALVCAVLWTCSFSACAEDAKPATEQLETVTVQLQKDPAIMPYAEMNEVLTKLQRVGEGLVRLDFKVMSKDTKKPVLTAKLALATDERYLPIPLAADGTFSLPLLPEDQAKNAELATNQTKGSLHIMGTLELTVTADQLDMKTVRRMMRVGHSLRTEMLPFYLRWMMPQVEGVRICSPAAAWQLEWPEGQQTMALPLAADPQEKDPHQEKSQTPLRPFCTVLSGQERWPDSARLISPAGSKLSVKMSR
ncbi:DUF2987 domain-containing protein [Roseateles koreensis]|uniref:DUF2987 domain-containing protein n=1 Tax=Roseateles koreensis TaxID=2987526 RepID=A0ABT5KL24_9BURK|nr:DUF2987 domain-containing protein [Roseateles koreensis]MDC8783598.1 DUF2987 domain-containing protein [Roseateles koreensis]